jgi:hypothetical protein
MIAVEADRAIDPAIPIEAEGALDLNVYVLKAASKIMMMSFPSTSVNGRYEVSFPPAPISERVPGDERLSHGAPELVVLVQPLRCCLSDRTVTIYSRVACASTREARQPGPSSTTTDARISAPPRY